MSDKQPKYRIVSTSESRDFQKQINEVHALGYKAVSITFGPGAGFLALMEFIGGASQSNFSK